MLRLSIGIKMYVNVEIKTTSFETLEKITYAASCEPVPHQAINCGYGNINVVYCCSKNDVSAIKRHWKSNISECFIVSI
jgi:hypothetical protein